MKLEKLPRRTAAAVAATVAKGETVSTTANKTPCFRL